MSAIDPLPTCDPKPQRDVMPMYMAFFAVFGGPLAWFIELNACFALASNPCFRDNVRTLAPQFAGTTFRIIVIIAVLSCLISLAAMSTGLRAHRLAQQQGGAGRARFLALWGICLGLGSALVIVLTAIAFFVLPRCAG